MTSVSCPSRGYVSFNHLHKKLEPISISEESDDSEEEIPQKKKKKKKKKPAFYRRVKIGKSDSESDTSVEPKTPTQIPKMCSGCNVVGLAPPTLTPTAGRVASSLCKLGYSTHTLEVPDAEHPISLSTSVCVARVQNHSLYWLC